MINFDVSFQNILWSHDELPYEPFIHEGILNTLMFNPKVTVGINDYINITLSQQIGIREMIWQRDEPSIHHRSENTSTDYIKPNGEKQAQGGILGDTKILIKYLQKDVGLKEGFRIYHGIGLVIPSKAVLRDDPFKSPADDAPIPDEDLNGDDLVDNLDIWFTGEYNHRHFSLSNGVYKASLETQIFYKQNKNPMFMGSVFSVDIPIEVNDYGYKPGLSYSVVPTLVIGRQSYDETKFNLLPAGCLFGLSFIGFNQSEWDGNPTPNSESKMIVPSIGGIWPTNNGVLSISIRKPFFVQGESIMAGNNVDKDALNNKTNAFEFSLGYRRNLGYLIPWL